MRKLFIISLILCCPFLGQAQKIFNLTKVSDVRTFKPNYYNGMGFTFEDKLSQRSLDDIKDYRLNNLTYFEDNNEIYCLAYEPLKGYALNNSDGSLHSFSGERRIFLYKRLGNDKWETVTTPLYLSYYKKPSFNEDESNIYEMLTYNAKKGGKWSKNWIWKVKDDMWVLIQTMWNIRKDHLYSDVIFLMKNEDGSFTHVKFIQDLPIDNRILYGIKKDYDYKPSLEKGVLSIEVWLNDRDNQRTYLSFDVSDENNIKYYSNEERFKNKLSPRVKLIKSINESSTLYSNIGN